MKKTILFICFLAIAIVLPYKTIAAEIQRLEVYKLGDIGSTCERYMLITFQDEGTKKINWYSVCEHWFGLQP